MSNIRRSTLKSVTNFRSFFCLLFISSFHPFPSFPYQNISLFQSTIPQEEQLKTFTDIERVISLIFFNFFLLSPRPSSSSIHPSIPLPSTLDENSSSSHPSLIRQIKVCEILNTWFYLFLPSLIIFFPSFPCFVPSLTILPTIALISGSTPLFMAPLCSHQTGLHTKKVKWKQKVECKWMTHSKMVLRDFHIQDT